MDDLAREIAALRDGVTPAWDEARSDRLFEGVGRLQRRRRLQRLIAGSALGAALVFGTVIGVQNLPAANGGSGALSIAQRSAGGSQPLAAASRSADQQPSAAVTRVSARQRVQLADGSSARVSSAIGRLDVLLNEPAHLELALRTGTAHFEVVPNTARRFVVTAGSVQVHVVGTVFDLERGDERVRVAVSEGKVRVETPIGTQFVRGGESAWFDPAGARLDDEAEPAARDEAAGVPSSDLARATADTKAPPARTDETSPESAPRSVREHRLKAKRLAAKEDKPVAAPNVSWRSLCQSGDYDAAYRLLESGTRVENDPAALMDAADAARLSNHPEASVAYLRRVLREHARSPVAPLAGFTLGRVLLERLGQPSEAAEAFSLARGIAPQGSLAQDALAREVEAWSKAGKSHEAYERAQLYVQLYPSGRRLRAVRLYGGLE